MVIQVAIGSYENALLGLETCDAENVELDKSSIGETMKIIFSCDDFTSKLRALAVNSSGKNLVAGTSDDMIKLFNVEKRSPMGVLDAHSGGITSIVFQSAEVLFTSSEDGTVAIFRTSDWNCIGRLSLKKSKHPSPVLSFTAHPSAPVALSVLKNSKLIIWDLTEFRALSSVKLPFSVVSGLVCWLSGQLFAIIEGNIIHVFDKDVKAVLELESPSKILSACRVSEGILVTGCEDGSIRMWKINQEKQVGSLVGTWEGHQARIRALDVRNVDKDRTIIASGSTDGMVVIWEVQSDLDLKCIGAYSSGLRITCIGILNPAFKATGSRKRKIKSDEENIKRKDSTRNAGPI